MVSHKPLDLHLQRHSIGIVEGVIVERLEHYSFQRHKNGVAKHPADDFPCTNQSETCKTRITCLIDDSCNAGGIGSHSY